jgi:GNAT superfamily N-acetyltransferase
MTINFVQLRLAKRGDFDAVRSLLYDLDEIAYGAQKAHLKPPHKSELTEARFAAWLENRQTRVVVALLKDGIVGFSRVEVQERPESRTERAALILRIHEMIVRAKQRRRGVGALLFEDISALAAHFDIDRIELALPHFNEGAARFLEKQGLKPISRILGRDKVS